MKHKQLDELGLDVHMRFVELGLVACALFHCVPGYVLGRSAGTLVRFMSSMFSSHYERLSAFDRSTMIQTQFVLGT